MKNSPILFILLVLFLSACSDTPPAEESRLGTVKFEASGNEEARPHFEKGLLLLHSFEYTDAAEAFRKAQEADPDFAMAYWGEAMTYNHSLWRNQKYEKAVEALHRLGGSPEERLAKANTPLEKDLLRAIEILYGEGDKFDRDEQYAVFMGELNKKYPGNHEIASFYALSLLGSVPVGRDEEVYEQSAAIAQGILNENPSHPGALHYLIHSYDDPYHATQALRAANSYAKVAPDAAHALHMPSHIFVALGMWKEVIASNIDSWEASVARMKRKELNNNARSYHALHWLQYGYLQKGQRDKAAQLLRDMANYCEELPSRNARSYLVAMKGAYLIETDDYFSELAEIEIDLDSLNIATRARYAYIEGMKAVAKNDMESLSLIIGQMEEARNKEALLVTESGIPMCSGASLAGNAPNQLDIDQAEVMEMELKGWLAWIQEDHKEAEKWLRQATEKESSLSYSYGPPEILKPSFELYGEWLLRRGDPEAAMHQFQESLKRAPKRLLSVSGLVDAAEQYSAEEVLTEAQAIIDEILAP